MTRMPLGKVKLSVDHHRICNNVPCMDHVNNLLTLVNSSIVHHNYWIWCREWLHPCQKFSDELLNKGPVNDPSTIFVQMIPSSERAGSREYLQFISIRRYAWTTNLPFSTDKEWFPNSLLTRKSPCPPRTAVRQSNELSSTKTVYSAV